MTAMETLTCTACDREWSRNRVRGRKPLQCPVCRGIEEAPTPPKELPKPAAKPGKPRKRKSKWAKMRDDAGTDPILETLPPASRTSGWCTDYDPVPAAQHDKCDGDLGKYRCPCECHGVE